MTPEGDADGDGVLQAYDCDDHDAEVGDIRHDADCDGVRNELDCNPDDPRLGDYTEDTDCDGVAAATDCDDSDASLGSRLEDADCDGILTDDDCKDADASLGARSEDADCDGILTDDDCDDTDVASLTRAEDGDCDGVPTADDCDDTDAASLTRAEDGDCDGFPTAEDCDDTNPLRPIAAEDEDCDGVDAENDCDDENPLAYPGAPERLLGTDLACDGNGGSLANADLAFVGQRQEDNAGTSVSAAGDVDGDGLDDLLVGAPGSDLGGSAAGKVYLFLGSSLDASASSAIALGDADFAFIGENGGDQVGTSVSAAGDVDGDGLDDLLVGASTNDDSGSDAGKAYLLLGSSVAASLSSTIDLSQADFAFIGENSVDYAGRSVSAAGDVDGDGRDDLLVGAYKNDDGGRDAGAAYLILGSSIAASLSSTIDLSQADFAFTGENASDHAGGSVCAAGDVDGDGRGDLLVGAPNNDDGGSYAGKAYLILGSSLAASLSSTIDLSQADFAFIGENEDDRAGERVSPAGDVDGDGLDDLLVGAPNNDDGGSGAGKVYLLLGSTLAASASSTIDLRNADFAFIGENRLDFAGDSVSPAGDVDGDGLDDLVVGVSQNDNGGTDAGTAYLLLGSTLAASLSGTIDLGDADFAFIGENSQDHAGTSVSAAGDVDGDGRDDLVVGAYGNDDRGSAAGKAYLIRSGL